MTFILLLTLKSRLVSVVTIFDGQIFKTILHIFSTQYLKAVKCIF